MTDDRIDFSPLDPSRDPQRFERIVNEISERAAPALAARRAEGYVLGQVTRWWKQLLTAAAITGIVSVSTLARVEPPQPLESTEIGIAEAIGVPGGVADWLWSDEEPTAEELLLALEDA